MVLRSGWTDNGYVYTNPACYFYGLQDLNNSELLLGLLQNLEKGKIASCYIV